MTQDIQDRLFDHFSQMVLDQGWKNVSCAQIAGAAGVEIKDAYGHYRNRFAYVTALIRRIDGAMLEAYDSDLAAEPARDRLFDVLMARFDAMQAYRPLIKSLSKSARYDPMLMVHLMALSRLTTDWIMDMAHISPSGVMGQVRAKGALAAYGKAFSVWLDDDSEDMSKTMAVLDKTLKRGEKALRRAERMACCLPFSRSLRKRCRGEKDAADSQAHQDRSVDEEGGFATVS